MFVLHEVFETPYDEVAEVVGKTPAAVRQIAHRAREHVAEQRPRMQVDRAQQEATLEKFMAAVTSGDVQGLVEVLAPEVILIADGGGLVRAARRPLVGAETVLAFLASEWRICRDWWLPSPGSTARPVSGSTSVAR